MQLTRVVTCNVTGYTQPRDPKLSTQGAGTVLSERDEIRDPGSTCHTFETHSGSARCHNGATGYGSTRLVLAPIEKQVPRSLVGPGKWELESHLQIQRPGCN